MCMNILSMCVCVHHVHPGADGSQKRVLDPIELELHTDGCESPHGCLELHPDLCTSNRCPGC